MSEEKNDNLKGGNQRENALYEQIKMQGLISIKEEYPVLYSRFKNALNPSPMFTNIQETL